MAVDPDRGVAHGAVNNGGTAFFVGAATRFDVSTLKAGMVSALSCRADAETKIETIVGMINFMVSGRFSVPRHKDSKYF